MSELTSFKLEMKLDGVNWTDITNDVLLGNGHVITLRYGNWSTMPTDLVAQGGKLTFDLDNSSANSTAMVGKYSPGHGSCLSGFDQGKQVRYSVLNGATRYYKFLGWLDKPLPTSDPFLDPHTKCTASDWLTKASITKIKRLPSQSSQRADQGVTTLLTKITEQPGAASFDTCVESFDTIFDLDRDENDTIYSLTSKLVRSEFGRCWIVGDTTQGGTLRLMSRHRLLLTTVSNGTFDEDADEIELEYSDEKVYDVLRMKIYPRRYDSAATTVLGSLVTGGNYLSIGPGETKQIILTYRDPSGSARIGGKDFVDPPVADTDYKFGSVGNGSSSDLNASITFTEQVLGGNSAFFRLTNTAAVTCYVNLFQLRGKGIYPYDPYNYESGTGDRVFEYDATYLQNKNTGIIIGDYLLSKVNAATKRISRLSWCANKSDAMLTAALTGEPGTRWTIQSAHQALSLDIFVNGVEWTLSDGLMLDVAWCGLNSSSETAWVLGTSALGISTTLAV
jgi:hypothetical protein